MNLLPIILSAYSWGSAPTGIEVFRNYSYDSRKVGMAFSAKQRKVKKIKKAMTKKSKKKNR